MTSLVWEKLNHDSIFNAVEEALGESMSTLLIKRNSYINRVYELEKQSSPDRIVAKFYRPLRWTREMILEEHQFLEELAAGEVPVIEPLKIKDKTLFMFEDMPFALFPKRGGRALDEFDKEGWKTIGRHIARMHVVGEKHKSSKRIDWKPARATAHHVETLFKTKYVLPDFESAFRKAAELFIKKAEPLFEGPENILLHGDLHKGNLIHRPGEGLYIIDFDDICMGPPVQDVWMLLPDKPENCENELSWFFDGYETFRSFDRKTLDLIPALRGMRIIHFVSWLSLQSSEPDFHKHFPEAGNKKYWNEIIKDIQNIVYEEL